MTTNGTARAWVDVDLSALVANARTVAERSQSRLLPMVKANGYGLGAVPVARALEAVDPWGFGVATPEEGAELRAAGIVRPIVVFTPFLPAWREACLAARLTPAIGDPLALLAWRDTGRPFHLEIDTGMSRGGVRWDDHAALDAVAVALRAGAPCEGLFTHFHSADTDAAATDLQWLRFQEALRALPARPALVHVANSAGALRGPRFGADLVRPGIFLYGGAAGEVPRPVAALRARVVAVRRLAAGDTASYGASFRAARPTTIATLGIGFADGLLRSLSGRGRAEHAGRVVRFAGRVTMDMTLIDVGSRAIAPGDVVTVWGGKVTLDAQAAAARTIGY
ncbi:MAG TPA: alanine racemase, partial [Gemmatimonadales bacterium]|nr:alanine racemase [Gemmatimonadales bacterium]